MSKSKIFLILSLAFIGGVFGRSFWEVNIFYCYLLALGGIIIIFTFYKNKTAAVVAFFLGFLALGIWLTDIKMEKLKHLDLNGQEFSGIVRIVKEPEIKDNYQNLVIQTEDAPPHQKTYCGIFKRIISRATGKEFWCGGKKKFLLNISAYKKYAYGDELQVKCVLQIPENKTFNYQMYLAKEGIFYICKSESIEIVNKEQGNKFYTFILTIKNKLLGGINQLLPAPESGLMIGVLLGGDDQLSKSIQNNFSKTGLTHIVAVSGYNVTIIAEYLLLLGIALGLWRKQALWFALFGIFLFVVMVGMPSSAVRAGIMGALLIWAMKEGRLANSTNAIVLAGAIMLLLNPLLLRYDIGFQLSFLATLGIVYFSPFLESEMIKKHRAFGLWEIIVLSLSAQIFVIPILIYNFQSLSLISLLANVLVLPIIPLTMLLGFLMLFLEMIFHPLAIVFSWLAYLPLRYEVEVINFLGNLKYSAITINNFSWIWVAVWYILLGVGIYFFRKHAKKENNL